MKNKRRKIFAKNVFFKKPTSTPENINIAPQKKTRE
jgi:hypothetical protein